MAQMDIRIIGTLFGKRTIQHTLLINWWQWCDLAISQNGRTNVAALSWKQNHKDQTEIQNSELLLFTHDIRGKNQIFQLDGEPICTANKVKKQFHTNNINVLSCPSHSQAKNPVKNIWAILSHKIYEGGHQFKTI